MKLPVKLFCTIVILSPAIFPVFGQESPGVYSTVLSPLEGQAVETESDGQTMLFEENGLSLEIRQGAGAYELDSQLILDTIWIDIMLHTGSEEIRPFNGSVGISFDGSQKHYPVQTGTSHYALPGDASEVFLTGVPYEMRLFFNRFDSELSGDTLDITLYLPSVQSKSGTVLMEEKQISLQGSIRGV